MQRYKYKPRSVRRSERKLRRNIFITLILGIGLLYFLFFWGLPTLITGLSFINKLKPQPKAETIEDEAIAPPVLSIPYEATNSARIKISGYASVNHQVEVYIDDQLQTSISTNEEGKFTTDFINLLLGTNSIYGISVNQDGKKSLPSKAIKVIFSSERPMLEVSEPQDGQEIQGGDKKVRVSGKTDFENSIVVNGATAIVNQDGNFSTQVPINDGENIITVEAINKVGNSTQIQKKVSYKP